ncbi:MAG TPA: 3-phosphoshikimate 1-carboxyvinyltransferase [Ruminococcaceae bacterium]|nr:3-phosphoshikimate 1-carboxyvinyltransferase [Oscillospiraceae bacterium]
MSIVKINGSALNGRVVISPSKSAAHRALICSFLAGGGTVKPIIDSKDMQATVGIIKALQNGESVLNCIESGSTLRFMIPVAAALGKSVTFVGEGRLPQRPIGEYLELLPMHNVAVESDGGLPLTISGKLKNGSYEVAGDVSSQYITGLLLALANLEGDSAIILTTPLQSKPYVDMTVKIMNDFGVKVTETDFGYLIHGGQSFHKMDYTVEGDWSQAAFFLVAGAINGDVTVDGLDMNTTQGDKGILDVLEAFGAKFEINENSVRCVKSALKGAVVDATDIPDLVPIISVLAAFSEGQTVIKGAERLRYKESDRIESVVENLKLIGADVTETEDGMIINGGKELHSAELKGYNDHRIVMAFSIAGLFLDSETVIDDANSINKSYPSFFEDYNSIGGKADVL